MQAFALYHALGHVGVLIPLAVLVVLTSSLQGKMSKTTHLAAYLVLRALLCSGSGSGFDSSFAIQVPKDCNVTDTQHKWPIDRHFAVHHRDCRQPKEQLYHPRHAFESTTEQPGRPPAMPNNSQTHPQSEGQPAAHVRALVQVRVLSHGLLCWLIVSSAVF